MRTTVCEVKYVICCLNIKNMQLNEIFREIIGVQEDVMNKSSDIKILMKEETISMIMNE